MAGRTLALTLTLTQPYRNPNPNPHPNQDAWRAEQDGLRVLHTQAEAKLASQLDESRKLLDAQREESRAQLSSLGDEMLRYRAEAEAAHEARGQAEAALP